MTGVARGCNAPLLAGYDAAICNTHDVRLARCRRDAHVRLTEPHLRGLQKVEQLGFAAGRFGRFPLGGFQRLPHQGIPRLRGSILVGGRGGPRSWFARLRLGGPPGADCQRTQFVLVKGYSTPPALTPGASAEKVVASAVVDQLGRGPERVAIGSLVNRWKALNRVSSFRWSDCSPFSLAVIRQSGNDTNPTPRAGRGTPPGPTNFQRRPHMNCNGVSVTQKSGFHLSLSGSNPCPLAPRSAHRTSNSFAFDTTVTAGHLAGGPR